MPKDIAHYISLERFSLFHCFFAYLDAKDYMADALFLKHQLRVRFLAEYAKEKSPYRIILCRIRKKDKAKFLNALHELPNKMLVCGYSDYWEQCKQIMMKIDSTKSGKDCA